MFMWIKKGDLPPHVLAEVRRYERQILYTLMLAIGAVAVMVIFFCATPEPWPTLAFILWVLCAFALWKWAWGR